ncbi:unknown [[Mannheimia] succiniciproducens MBEL55E]|uniref:Uncharacterized protein n=1 Tax=Mannheimia succiniciproducens (strain KCTC 0769BP / MBEL55E) TaxID=221988 RepID=Q65VA7_MANSM|nr:unknown [[Mannheimia] succiniciproducens MBEL55E]
MCLTANYLSGRVKNFRIFDRTFNRLKFSASIKALN